MPFFCDMLGIALLILALWWVRKFGAIAMTGIIATITTLILNPVSTQFLGFTTASIIFDILTRLVGYRNSLEKSILSPISLLFASFVSTAMAGIIIANLFMDPNFLTAMFGGATFFAILHAAGGIFGAVIGIFLIKMLSMRISLQKV